MVAAVKGIDLNGKRLAICLGPGGVGKTTLSAAFALAAALRGRTVDVMTVDPAPRLIDALGLEGEATAPRLVALKGLDGKRGGRLRALKLEPKQTFDALVERHAPTAAARDAILANRIYRNLSNALAGVADYMAMERLLELYRNNPAGLVVLDTPPAAEAIDFLDAPRRMLDLLSSRALTLLAPRGMMRRPLAMIDLAARAVLKAFDRLTGLHLLADVQAFVRGFDGMYEGFAERAAAAQDLLRDERSFIVVVTTAERERVGQAADFVAALNRLGFRIGAVAVNRLTMTLPESVPKIFDSPIDRKLRRKLERNLADHAALKAREAAAFDQLRECIPPGTPTIITPDLGREPRTLADLAAIAATMRFE